MTEPTAGPDAVLARDLAQRAGEELLALRASLGFGDPAALRHEGDQQSHRLLLDLLRRHRPDDAVLSEEGDGDTGRTGRTRLTADRVWIIDPLDGTREYAEDGRDDWAVHVALWQDGRLAEGAVALPAQNVILATAAPPIRPARANTPPRIAVSRTRPAAFIPDVARAVSAVLVPLGSAGAKVGAVITGKVDAYVHAGGQYEWDSAAPVAVADAVGLHSSRIDGAPLTYNNPDPMLPDLVVCRPELADALLAAIAAVR